MLIFTPPGTPVCRGEWDGGALEVVDKGALVQAERHFLLAHSQQEVRFLTITMRM